MSQPPHSLSVQLQQLVAWARSLLVYRAILEAEASQSFFALLKVIGQFESEAGSPASTESGRREGELLNAYGAWFAAIAPSPSWQAWIEQHILAADNPLTQALQRVDLDAVSPTLIAAAQHDLRILQQWATKGITVIQSALAEQTNLNLPLPLEAGLQILSSPQRSNREPSLVGLDFSQFSEWSAALPALAIHYRQRGVGLFSQYLALRWRGHMLEGIEHPELIQMADLIGYETQRTTLQMNTEALLAGHAALNILLYGSRGSGKSALVKSLLTEYGDRGLRLIELSKADMIHLPQVVESLRHSSLKFVIFVDDLSFEEDEENYKALKVVLEGTLAARPQNVVVYATSNRRHLIREFFGDRPPMSEADEVHSWDTVQEKLSLSDRFGLTLTFEPANQDTYLQIVRGYAQRFAIKVSDEDLTYQALQWAVRHNVRSGRTARQFIDHLRAQLALEARH